MGNEEHNDAFDERDNLDAHTTLPVAAESSASVSSMFDLLPPQPEASEGFEKLLLGQTSEYFAGANQYQRELERIYRREWLAVEQVSRLREPGQFTTVNVGGDSLLIVRGDAQIQAFHNFCRHRGLRLVEECSGRRARFLCPYHHWVYDRNGNLTKIVGTMLDELFDPAEHGLVKVHTEVRHGIVFVCLADEPPSLDEHLGDFPIFAKRYELDDLVCTSGKDYVVQSNWKVIFHNVNEALHFPAMHADLDRVTDYDKAGYYQMRGNIVGAWQSLREGFNSISMSGLSTRPPLPDVPPVDRHQVNWISLLPNLLIAFTSDYVSFQWVWPLAPDRSLVRHLWAFHPKAAAAPTFSDHEVVALWDKANLEDWVICEQCHRGLASPSVRPGVFALDEEVLYQIDRYVVNATRD